MVQPVGPVARIEAVRPAPEPVASPPEPSPAPDAAAMVQPAGPVARIEVLRPAPVASPVSPEPSPAPEALAEPVASPYPEVPREPPIHEAGAAGRLLAAAGELEAYIAQAREQLDALEEALGRLERYDPPAD
jgi:hypothetical protein